MSEIDRRAYIERTDVLVLIAKGLQLLTQAIHANTDAINRNTDSK